MKLFDLKEANKALILIKPIVRDIIRQNEALTIIQNIIASREVFSSSATATLERDQRLGTSYSIHYFKELANLGVILTDIDNGTVDFPSIAGPNKIFLCWTYGQEEVTFFHGKNCNIEYRQNIYTLI